MRAVIEQAMDLLGTEYCSAGATPDCFDCSGFVMYCFQAQGTSLPRISADMFSHGTPVDRADIQGGDLVFFAINGGKINHVGIALNERQFIHSSSSKGVSIAPFSDSYWSRRYVGAKRLRTTK